MTTNEVVYLKKVWFCPGGRPSYLCEYCFLCETEYKESVLSFSAYKDNCQQCLQAVLKWVMFFIHEVQSYKVKIKHFNILCLKLLAPIMGILNVDT